MNVFLVFAMPVYEAPVPFPISIFILKLMKC